MHTLLTAVTRQLTNIRADIKATVSHIHANLAFRCSFVQFQIWLSLEPNLRNIELKQKKTKDKNPFEFKRNVAALAHTISHSTDVKITYHHYTRLAFLVSLYNKLFLPCYLLLNVSVTAISGGEFHSGSQQESGFRPDQEQLLDSLQYGIGQDLQGHPELF